MKFLGGLLKFVSLIVSLSSVKAEDPMPAPFYRELYVTTPYMSGNDVLIAQTLLLRYVIAVLELNNSIDR